MAKLIEELIVDAMVDCARLGSLVPYDPEKAAQAALDERNWPKLSPVDWSGADATAAPTDAATQEGRRDDGRDETTGRERSATDDPQRDRA